MPYLSIVINCDTRQKRNEQEGLFSGAVNLDFLTDGVRNKQLFFSGFDIETIVFIDKHNDIPQEVLEYLYKVCDTVVVRKHTSENKFNDYNYLSALQMARGEIIVHFDQDVAAFASSKESVENLLSYLDKYSFVSYPSPWSPNPVVDHHYDYWWASTRFFMCKKDTLDFTEIKKCLESDEYLYGKYPASVRNPWFEHIAGLWAKYNGNGVYYPPIQTENLTIFTWERYEDWTMRRMNEYTYQEIYEWHNTHPIFYPCNCNA